MWEDPQNRCGGRWLVNLSKTQRMQELDRLWLETVSIFLIGIDQFVPGSGKMLISEVF